MTNRNRNRNQTIWHAKYLQIWSDTVDDAGDLLNVCNGHIGRERTCRSNSIQLNSTQNVKSVSLFSPPLFYFNQVSIARTRWKGQGQEKVILTTHKFEWLNVINCDRDFLHGLYILIKLDEYIRA